MADYFTGYQNALPQTSLADMMNLASSAQQYKQAQALNPLSLQAKQLELQQAQENYRQALATNPDKAAEIAANAKLAGVNLDTARLTQAPTVSKAYSGAAEAMSQADLAKLNLTSSYIRQGAQKALQLIGKKDLTYEDVVSELDKHLDLLGASPEAREFAKKSIPVTKDQTVLQDALRDFSLQSLTAEQQMNKRFPAATAQVTEAGKTTIVQPAAFPGTKPTITQGVAGGVQGMPQPEQGAPQPIGQVAPQGVQPQQMGAIGPSAPVKPSYPVRVGQGAGTYTPAVGEEDDRATGVKMRQALTTNLNNSAQMNRNLEESLKSITKLDPGAFYSSGFAGTVRRNVANFFGSSDYKELSKNLANLQIAQLQAQGQSLQTDSGKHLLAMASGDETYNPDVLMDIVQRTAATQKELQLKAPAMQIFAQKYGDANYAKFNQEWSNNADSKVFQVMNIIDKVKDPAQQKAQIDALLGNDKAKRKEYLQKYDNIQKLVNGGSLN
jgi:hypothetical protein